MQMEGYHMRCVFFPPMKQLLVSVTYTWVGLDLIRVFSV